MSETYTMQCNNCGNVNTIWEKSGEAVFGARCKGCKSPLGQTTRHNDDWVEEKSIDLVTSGMIGRCNGLEFQVTNHELTGTPLLHIGGMNCQPAWAAEKLGFTFWKRKQTIYEQPPKTFTGTFRGYPTRIDDNFIVIEVDCKLELKPGCKLEFTELCVDNTLIPSGTFTKLVEDDIRQAQEDQKEYEEHSCKVKHAIELALPGCAVFVSRGYGSSMYVKVIASQFTNRNATERQTIVDDVLQDALGVEEHLVSLITCYSPEEL